jgi:hypothetical protein
LLKTADGLTVLMVAIAAGVAGIRISVIKFVDIGIF